jgi:uncharacterized protein (DUF1778 family)
MAATKRQFNLRLEPEDRTLFDLAATAKRESLSQFLVESGRERAERLLADRNEFSLDSDQWGELMAALDRPARVKPEIADLFSRPRPE